MRVLLRTTVFMALLRDVCGTISNTRFGQSVLTNNFDSELLRGWGVWPSDWSFNVSVQQLLPRMSVTR